MRLIRFDTVSLFLEHARPFLLPREAEHNLLLSVSAALLRDPTLYASEPYCVVVETDNSTVVVALRTPPHGLIISHVEPAHYEAALALIAADARAVYGDTLPTVLSAQPVSHAFAQMWSALTDTAHHVTVHERIYKLEQVKPPLPVSGYLRPATLEDAPLIIDWMGAFEREALPHTQTPRAELERRVLKLLAPPTPRAYLWVDEQPVTLVGHAPPALNSVRIGPVYTPPSARRRGYASAGVAAVSQLLLDAGYQFCCLYTDLANPTSNKIYMDIGYEPVVDVHMIAFTYGKG